MDPQSKQTSQGTFKDTLVEQDRTNIEKGSQKRGRVPSFGTHFWSKVHNEKHEIIIQKSAVEKYWKNITKRGQKGTHWGLLGLFNTGFFFYG